MTSTKSAEEMGIEYANKELSHWEREDNPLFQYDEMRDEMSLAYQAGFSAGEERAGKWISVKERLPEPNQRVLVYDPTVPEFPRNDTHTVIGHYRGPGWETFGDWYVHDGRGEVTHWLPLPPPPEKEEK